MPILETHFNKVVTNKQISFYTLLNPNRATAFSRCYYYYDCGHCMKTAVAWFGLEYIIKYVPKLRICMSLLGPWTIRKEKGGRGSDPDFVQMILKTRCTHINYIYSLHIILRAKIIITKFVY